MIVKPKLMMRKRQAMVLYGRQQMLLPPMSAVTARVVLRLVRILILQRRGVHSWVGQLGVHVRQHMLAGESSRLFSIRRACMRVELQGRVCRP